MIKRELIVLRQGWDWIILYGGLEGARGLWKGGKTPE